MLESKVVSNVQSVPGSDSIVVMPFLSLLPPATASWTSSASLMLVGWEREGAKRVHVRTRGGRFAIHLANRFAGPNKKLLVSIRNQNMTE